DGYFFPGGYHTDLDVHDGARSELPHVPDAGYFRGIPSGVASPEQSGTAGESDQDQHVSRESGDASARKAQEHSGRRRQSAGSFADSVWKRYEQQQRAQSLAAAGAGGGRRGRQDEGRTSREVSREHAHVESAADDSGQGRRASGERRRQHGNID